MYANLTDAQVEAAIYLMDDDLREELSNDWREEDGTDHCFIWEYAKRHQERFGVRFEPAYRDGQW